MNEQARQTAVQSLENYNKYKEQNIQQEAQRNFIRQQWQEKLGTSDPLEARTKMDEMKAKKEEINKEITELQSKVLELDAKCRG